MIGRGIPWVAVVLAAWVAAPSAVWCSEPAGDSALAAQLGDPAHGVDLASLPDARGDRLKPGGAGPSLLGRYTERFEGLRRNIEWVSRVARAIDAERLERPAWLNDQFRFVDERLGRLERMAANVFASVDSPSWRELRDTRTAAARLAASPSRRAPGNDTNPTIVEEKESGQVEGRVTDSARGKGLKGLLVIIFTQTDPQYPLKQVRTDSGGMYRLRGLAAGTYFIEVMDISKKPVYAGEVYDNLPWHVGAYGTPVRLGDGVTVGGINFALDRGAQIRGTVSDAWTGRPLGKVGVEVYLPRVGRAPGWPMWLGMTNGQGKFDSRYTPLNPIVHRLWFYAPSGYVDEGYDDVLIYPGPEYKRLTPIPLEPGKTYSFDIDLQPDTKSSYISGQIYDATSKSTTPGGVTVEVTDLVYGGVLGVTTTDRSGYYRVGPGWSGIYGVTARPDFSTGYAVQVYKNRGEGADFTPVVCAPEAETGGIDFPLVRWGGISGRILDKDGKYPLFGINVVVIYKPEPSPRPVYIPLQTDEDGLFACYGLNPQQNYRAFTCGASDYHYTDQMYKNIPCEEDECDCGSFEWDWTVGTPITVRPGEMATDINFLLAKR